MAQVAAAIVVLAGWLLAPGFVFAQTKPAQSPAEVSGTWTGEIKTPVSYSPISISLKLEQTPKGLTGVAWPGPGEVPIKNVTRKGDKVSFELSGGNVVYRFSLTATVDRLEGETFANDNGHTWTGKATLKREKDTEKRSPQGR